MQDDGKRVTNRVVSLAFAAFNAGGIDGLTHNPYFTQRNNTLSVKSNALASVVRRQKLKLVLQRPRRNSPKSATPHNRPTEGSGIETNETIPGDPPSLALQFSGE